MSPEKRVPYVASGLIFRGSGRFGDGASTLAAGELPIPLLLPLLMFVNNTIRLGFLTTYLVLSALYETQCIGSSGSGDLFAAQAKRNSFRTRSS